MGLQDADIEALACIHLTTLLIADMVAHVTDTLPLRDELLSRTAMFVSKCVDSENKSAQSNLGTGPRCASCARRWQA